MFNHQHHSELLGFFFVCLFDCFFAFRVIPSNDQGLFLSLHSGTILSSAQDAIWDARHQARSGSMQDKHPPYCAIDPAQSDILLQENSF